MSQVFGYVVEVSELQNSPRHGSCSPTPSTSGSTTSSSSGAGSPTNSEQTRKIVKRRRTYMERRKGSRITASKSKYAKKLASASKLRLWKAKVDKAHAERLAAQQANIERMRRERELLHSGRSQIAILCETVSSDARSLRAHYERQQQAVVEAILSTVMVDDSEDGFVGHVFY